MQSSTIVFLVAMALLFAASSYATPLSEDDVDGIEESPQQARTFLPSRYEDKSSSILDKRESGKNCVPCKFGIGHCCAPNICVKKTLQPDHCMEVKTAHGH